MKLMEEFANLTPEQREKFAAVKDAAALDAYVFEINIELTEEEKTQAAEYFEKGMLPLGNLLCVICIRNMIISSG